MSNGPIQQERDGHKVAAVSTTDSARVCWRYSVKVARAYCGRSSTKTLAAVWDEVTCEDCRAAGRADGLNVPVERNTARRSA